MSNECFVNNDISMYKPILRNIYGSFIAFKPKINCLSFFCLDNKICYDGHKYYSWTILLVMVKPY